MTRGHAAGLAVALSLGALFGAHRIVDLDPFQRVALGREILEHPAALGASRLLFPVSGFRFVDDKWLSSVLVAIGYGACGGRALIAYQVGLAALLAGAWYAMLRAWGAAAPIALAGTAITLVADAFRLEPRPDTVSQLLCAVLVGLLGSSVPLRRLRWIVPLLLGVWANLHGYFVLGLLVLAASAPAAALGDARLLPGFSGGRRARALHLTALLGLSTAACCVHPQGVRALLWPWEQLGILAREPILREAIQEFFPTRDLFEGLGTAHALGLAAVTAASLALVGRLSRRSAVAGLAIRAVVPLTWLVLPGPGFAAWPYRVTLALAAAALLEIPEAVAGGGWFPPLVFAGALVLAWPMIRNLSLVPPAAALLVAPAWTGRLERLEYDLERLRPRRLAWTAAAVVVLAAAAGRFSDHLAPGTTRRPGWTGLGIDTAAFPAAAADFVAREKVPGPLLNNFDCGGFLLTTMGPGSSVFIADNTSMYPAAFLSDYRRLVMGGTEPAEELHRRYGVRSILLDHAAMETPSLLARLARSPDWALVFADRVAAVFVHREPSTEEFLLAHSVTLELAAHPSDPPFVPVALGGRRHLFPRLNYAIFLRAIGRPELALIEADRLWAGGPATEIATFTAAAAEEAHRLPEAVDRLEAALRLEPRSEVLRSWTSRALVFRADRALSEGRVDDARRDLERCREVTPKEPGPLLALAKIANGTGNRQEAIRLIREAMSLAPGDAVKEQLVRDPQLSPLLDH